MILAIKIILIIASIPLIVWLVKRVIENARRLDKGIQEYHEEQAAKGPGDPLADFINLFAEKKGTGDK